MKQLGLMKSASKYALPSSLLFITTVIMCHDSMLGLLDPSPVKKIQNQVNKTNSLISSSGIKENNNFPTNPSIKDLPAALRQFALMRFLQFTKVAEAFAQVSEYMLNGKFKYAVEMAFNPIIKSFSIGDSQEIAIKKALLFLENNQNLLIDYVEEMVKTPEAREAVFYEINKLLDAISETKLSYIPIKLTAIIDHNILEKMSRGESLTTAEEGLFTIENTRLDQLIAKAEKYGKTIFIDQEYPHQKTAIFKLSQELMMRYNHSRPVVYVTIQATDVECFNLLKQLSNNQAIHFPAVKLVNGAYVDWAHENKYSSMMQSSKMASFVAFILMAKFCLKKGMYLFVGTHNLILEQLINNIAQFTNIPQSEATIDKDKNLISSHKVSTSHKTSALVTSGFHRAQQQKTKYSDRLMTGQLYGFHTKNNIGSMYAIYGANTACGQYSLRRIIEGAGGHTAASSPILSTQEVYDIVDKASLNETITPEEIEIISKAVKFNVQQARVELARENIYKIIKR